MRSTSLQVHYVPAYSVFRTEKADSNTDSLSLLFKACENLGMKNIDTIKQDFSKISRIKETRNLLENTQSHHFYFAKRNSSNF